MKINKKINKKLTKSEEKKIRKEIKTIKMKIKPLYLKYEKFLSTSTYNAWNLGKRFNKLKNLNKELGVKWEKYRYNNFPYIKERKAQRYMRLAKHINMKEFPALSLISIDDLERLITQCKDTEVSVKGVLEGFRKAIEFKKVPDDVNLIGDFKELFKEMSDGLRPSSTGWYDTDDKPSDYEREIKEDRKMNGMIQRMLKKQIKKEGKIYSGTLIISINRVVKKLVENFDWLLNKKNKIVNLEDFGDLDYEKIKILIELLKMFKMANKEKFARNCDLPNDDDV